MDELQRFYLGRLAYALSKRAVETGPQRQALLDRAIYRFLVDCRGAGVGREAREALDFHRFLSAPDQEDPCRILIPPTFVASKPWPDATP